MRLSGPSLDTPHRVLAESVIQTEGLTVAYGDEKALHDVSCHFDRHRVTAIMGPSGCGKSTLVRTLNRTLELMPGARLVSGSVLLHGKDIYDKNQSTMEIRKRIGIIHQRPVPFPMSILENVLFGVRFYNNAKKAALREYAESYLDRVGLLDEVKDRLGEPASRLSGGQQQRLCLARALANRPEVILMDEPCSSIDPAATQRIEELIKVLREQYTIIIVTHNMSQAKRVSDHAIFMFAGRIIEAGETEAIFSGPRTDLARQFITGIIG